MPNATTALRLQLARKLTLPSPARSRRPRRGPVCLRVGGEFEAPAQAAWAYAGAAGWVDRRECGHGEEVGAGGCADGEEILAQIDGY